MNVKDTIKRLEMLKAIREKSRGHEEALSIQYEINRLENLKVLEGKENNG